MMLAAVLVQASLGRGDVALEPKGESEPFPIDDPSRYTKQEIDKINRRVELFVE